MARAHYVRESGSKRLLPADISAIAPWKKCCILTRFWAAFCWDSTQLFPPWGQRFVIRFGSNRIYIISLERLLLQPNEYCVKITLTDVACIPHIIEAK